MASKRAKAAAKAAKRIPLVGTTVVVLPVISAATEAGLSASTITNMGTWREFFKTLAVNYTGYNPDTGQFDGGRAIRTYGPIAGYLISRRFLGKHITRVLRPLGVRF